MVLSSYEKYREAIVSLKKYSVSPVEVFKKAVRSVTTIVSNFFKSLKGEPLYLLLVPNADNCTEPHLLEVVKEVLKTSPNIVLVENILRRLDGQVATHLSSSGAPRNFEQRKGIPF